MSSDLQLSDRHKHVLGILLTIKKENGDRHVIGLQDAIRREVVLMGEEDIAWVEKIVGTKAL